MVDTALIRKTADAVLHKCIRARKRRDNKVGGFATIGLQTTVDGVAAAKPAPNGYGKGIDPV